MNTNLPLLPDLILLQTAENLASQERMIGADLIAHLREIDRRKLYVDRGCNSLYAYCVKILKYSEGSAQRRVNATRLTVEIPEVEKKLRSGDLTMTHLARAHAFFIKEEKISGTFSLERKRELLGRLEGKSSREAERELLRHSSQSDVHYQESTRVISSTLTEIRFAATHEQMETFEKARGPLANQDPYLSWAEFFTKTSELAMKVLDPRYKSRRSVSPAVAVEDPYRRTNCSLCVVQKRRVHRLTI